MNNLIDVLRKKPLTILSIVLVLIEMSKHYFYLSATTSSLLGFTFYNFSYVPYYLHPFLCPLLLVSEAALLYGLWNDRPFVTAFSLAINLTARHGALSFGLGDSIHYSIFSFLSKNIVFLAGMFEVFYRFRVKKEEIKLVEYIVRALAAAVPFVIAALHFEVWWLLFRQYHHSINLLIASVFFFIAYQVLMSNQKRWAILSITLFICLFGNSSASGLDAFGGLACLVLMVQYFFSTRIVSLFAPLKKY